MAGAPGPGRGGQGLRGFCARHTFIPHILSYCILPGPLCQFENLTKIMMQGHDKVKIAMFVDPFVRIGLFS